jgi:hypothetical protein
MLLALTGKQLQHLQQGYAFMDLWGRCKLGGNPSCPGLAVVLRYLRHVISIGNGYSVSWSNLTLAVK